MKYVLCLAVVFCLLGCEPVGVPPDEDRCGVGVFKEKEEDSDEGKYCLVTLYLYYNSSGDEDDDIVDCFSTREQRQEACQKRRAMEEFALGQLKAESK